MNKKTRLCCSLLTASLLFFFASAAQAARSYLVELVVFTTEEATDAEQLNTAETPLNTRKMSRALLPATIMDAYKEPLAEVNESNFSYFVNRLHKNPVRKVILKTHWVQSVLSPSKTTIARITNRRDIPANPGADGLPMTATTPNTISGAASDTLDGYINFYLDGQYALEADIRFTPAYRPSILDEKPDAGPLSYRIYEKRRMKSGELNYYDHPKIGMVLRVTPVSLPDQEAEPSIKAE